MLWPRLIKDVSYSMSVPVSTLTVFITVCGQINCLGM